MDDLLIRAAELIENDWKRGFLGQPGRGMCLDGALRATIEEQGRWCFSEERSSESMNLVYSDEYIASLQRLASVIPPCSEHPRPRVQPGSVGKAQNDVWHYNDKHCTGGVEAAKILRNAAEVEL